MTLNKVLDDILFENANEDIARDEAAELKAQNAELVKALEALVDAALAAVGEES